MAKTKKAKELKAHFFMSVSDGTVHVIYDDNNDPVALAAAFASAMTENTNLFDIISTAFITLLDEKEKTTPKKKPNPKQMDGVKSDAPFVKTRKKKAK